MRFLAASGFGLFLATSGFSMTLAFANKWNVISPASEASAFTAPAPNGQYFACGISGYDLIMRRVDEFGNVWAQRTVDYSLGGYEQPMAMESDGTNAYIVYRTDRIGSIQLRLVKLNAALGTVWDIDLGGGPAQGTTLAVDGSAAYAPVQTASGTELVRVNGTSGAISYRQSFGATHQFQRIALSGTNVILAGKAASLPRLMVLNKESGATVSSVVPTSLSFTTDEANDYQRVVVDGARVFAVGRGSVGGTFNNFRTMCTTSGASATHTIGDTKTNVSLAANNGRAYWVREDSSGVTITRHTITTGAQTGLYPLPDLGADSAIAVSPDGEQIAIALESNSSNYLLALFSELLDGVNFIAGPAEERIGDIEKGADPDGFFTAGVINRSDGRDSRFRRVSLDFANWASNYSSTGFPLMQVAGSAEDATGARYLAINSQGGTTQDARNLVLKVNAAGVVQWSRVLDLRNESTDVVNLQQIAVGPDGGVVVAGRSVTDGFDGTPRIALAKMTTGGATTWISGYAHADNCPTSMRNFAIAGDNSIYLFGTTNFVSNTSDALVVKMNSSGQAVWSRVYDGGRTSDTVYGGAVLPNGTIASAVVQGASPLVRVFSAAGVVLWTQGLPDTGGADPREIVMRQEPNGVLALAIAYRRASPARNVIGIRRVNAVTKTVLMQSTLGSAEFPDFGVAANASGNVSIWFEAPSGMRVAQVNGATGASMFNNPAPTNVINGFTSDRKNNLYLAIHEQPSPASPPNAAIVRYSSSGTQTHKRTFGGSVSEVSIGLGDSIWATGGRWVLNRGFEATFTKWTQTLAP